MIFTFQFLVNVLLNTLLYDSKGAVVQNYRMTISPTNSTPNCSLMRRIMGSRR